MKKRVILVILLLFLFVFLSRVYSADLNLALTTSKYGPSQNFDGYLILNTNETLSVSDLFKASIDGNQVASINLKNWLDNSSINYNYNTGSYSVVGNAWQSKQILTEQGNKIVGFGLPSSTSSIRNISFNLYGYGNVLIDIGDDNELDWQYKGAQQTWGPEIYPENYSSTTSWDSEIGIAGNNQYRRCQYLNIDFNELYNETAIQIFAQVKKITNGGDLKAIIENKECDIPETSLISTEFKKVICTVTLDVLESGEHQICLFSQLGNTATVYYKLPKKDDFYFITIKKASYSNSLSGNALVDTKKVKDKLQNLLNSCTSSSCVLPIKVYLNSSGQITINNILLRDNDLVDYTAMYDLNKLEDYITLNKTSKFLLSKFYDLKTPSIKGRYSLFVSFKNISSNLSNFEVADVPIANIKASTLIATKNQQILFSGEDSISPTNSNITKYEWDFGDNTKASGVKVTHLYQNFGNYTVSLVVEDQNNLRSSPKTIIIDILSLESILPSLINETKTKINGAKDFMDNSNEIVSDTYELLGYDLIIDNAIENITNLENKFNSINASDEEEYLEIFNNIEDMRNKVPISMNLGIFELKNALVDYNDIPNNLFTDETSKSKIYRFNIDNVKVDAESRLLDIEFISGNGKFKLIKKNIDVTGGENNIIIEDFSGIVDSLDEVKILTPDYELDEENNQINWDLDGGSKEILYTLKFGNIEEFGKTIVISEFENETVQYECGDGICTEPYEDKENCPDDCAKKIPWSLYIILIVIIAAGVFYFNFYKGPGNFKDLANWLSIKFRKKRLFTNEKDLTNLSTYVKTSLAHGFNEQSIRNVLLRKGWTNEQIDYAFKKKKI